MSTIDWLPVDLLSEAVVELGLLKDGSAPKNSASFFHAVNPKITTWDALLPAIRKRLQEKTGREIGVVPWADWVEAVRRTGQDGDGVAGVKLLDFYDALGAGGRESSSVIYDTTATQKASAGIRNLTAVDEKMMVLWMQQWGL